jgi:oxygen-independent coproporphyrinogen-3 oxidase
MGSKETMMAALGKELLMRKEYLASEVVSTIYLGGGTPTVCNPDEIKILLGTVFSSFSISVDVEVSIEANPDDLSMNYLLLLRKIGFNRISLGVQSYHNHELLLLNRRHDINTASTSIASAKKAGFDNISIDLIYGIPGSSEASWAQSLDRAIEASIQHISAYHLSVEPGTYFYRQKEKGLLHEVDESLSVAQYGIMTEKLLAAGFIHYEISSFGLPGFFSRHNTSYWKGAHYLGIGPSAHSYNGVTREWNIANNNKYIHQINQGQIPSELEVLTLTDRYNDYVLTSLRTMWGMDLEHIRQEYGNKYYIHANSALAKCVDSGLVETEGNTFRLSPSGRFVSDGIISEFMMLCEE